MALLRQMTDLSLQSSDSRTYTEDWQLNVLVKFNVNPRNVIQVKEDPISNRLIVTETEDGLQLLKGLPILAIDERDVSSSDSHLLCKDSQTLPALIKFGDKPIVMDQLNMHGSNSCFQSNEQIPFLGATSSVGYDVVDNKEAELDSKLEIVPEEDCRDSELTLDESLEMKANLQPISFDGTQGDKSSWTEKCKRRANIITELLSTEKNYIEELKQLNNEFLKPFVKPLKKSTKIDISSFHIMILNLIKLHEKIYSNFCSSKNICTVFQQEFMFLKMYKEYIRDYEETYGKLQKASKMRSFKWMFNNKGEGSQVSSDPIAYFHSRGITIVQRPPRYILLLQRLRKYTPISHPMYCDLKNGLLEIQDTCNDINEYQRQFDNRLKLIDLSEEIDHRTLRERGIKTLLDPARRLIRTGKVAIRRIKSARMSFLSLSNVESLSFELGRVVLCNDILIIMSGRKNRVSRVFRLAEIEAKLNREPIKPSNNNQNFEKVFEVILNKRSEELMIHADEEDTEDGLPLNRRSKMISLRKLTQMDYCDDASDYSIYVSTIEEAEIWEKSILKYSYISYVN